MTVTGPYCPVPGVQGPSQLLCNSGELGPGGSKPASHPCPGWHRGERRCHRLGGTVAKGSTSRGLGEGQLRAWRAGRVESLHTDDCLAEVVVVTTHCRLLLLLDQGYVVSSTCHLSAPGQALYQPFFTSFS